MLFWSKIEDFSAMVDSAYLARRQCLMLYILSSDVEEHCTLSRQAVEDEEQCISSRQALENAKHERALFCSSLALLCLVVPLCRTKSQTEQKRTGCGQGRLFCIQTVEVDATPLLLCIRRLHAGRYSSLSGTVRRIRRLGRSGGVESGVGREE